MNIAPGDFIAAEGIVSATKTNDDGSRWIEIEDATVTKHVPQPRQFFPFVAPTCTQQTWTLVFP